MRTCFLWLVLVGLASAQSVVREGGAVLFDSCTRDADRVATLEARQPVKIAFALSGERGNCVKVSTTLDGKLVQGYVEAASLQGLEDFEHGRRAASDTELPQSLRSEIGNLQRDMAQAPAASGGPAGSDVARAFSLIERGEPREALNILETAVQKQGDDPTLLAAAGLAAFQSDNPRRALYFWRNAQRIRPNPSVDSLIRRAEQEIGADVSDNVIHGARFVLRYESTTADSAQAGGMLRLLEDEYNRISGQLGCLVREQTVAIVQSPSAYRAATAAAEWSGGQYDGRIHVPLATGAITPQTRQVFAHEIVHACLASLGRWPVWFHEGMAQYHSGERLSAAAARQFTVRAREGRMPGLGSLSPSFSRMSTAHAASAYAISLAAVEVLYRDFGADYVRNLLRNPQLLSSIEPTLSQKVLP
jgi:hypothetical protein